MNDLVQVIQVLTPEEVEFVNTELDKKQFTVSSIGFDDGETGEPVDEWGCAVVWMPTLLIENSQQQRQTGAAVESFRNETLSRISQTISMKKIDDPTNELEGDGNF